MRIRLKTASHSTWKALLFLKEHVSFFRNICHSRAVCWMWNVTKPELTQIWVEMCWFREIKQRVMIQSNAKMIIPHQHGTFSDVQPLVLVIKSTKMEQIFHSRLCTSCFRGGRGFSFIPKTDLVGLERHVILKKSPRLSTGLFMREGKLKQNSLFYQGAELWHLCWAGVRMCEMVSSGYALPLTVSERRQGGRVITDNCLTGYRVRLSGHNRLWDPCQKKC